MYLKTKIQQMGSRIPSWKSEYSHGYLASGIPRSTAFNRVSIGGVLDPDETGT